MTAAPAGTSDCCVIEPVINKISKNKEIKILNFLTRKATGFKAKCSVVVFNEEVKR